MCDGHNTLSQCQDHNYLPVYYKFKAVLTKLQSRQEIPDGNPDRQINEQGNFNRPIFGDTKRKYQNQ